MLKKQIQLFLSSALRKLFADAKATAFPVFLKNQTRKISGNPAFALEIQTAIAIIKDRHRFNHPVHLRLQVLIAGDLLLLHSVCQTPANNKPASFGQNG